MTNIGNPKFADAEALFAAACRASREHARLGDQACETYGGHGALISGCVRDHFPAEVKDTLRHLAREVGRLADQARACRPARVRLATMAELYRDVARRDGKGFYGPLL